MVLAVFCAALGIVLSILAGTPVGATIVVVYIAFLLFSLANLIMGKDSSMKKRPSGYLMLLLVSLLLLSACSGDKKALPRRNSPPDADVIQVDISRLSETVMPMPRCSPL